MTQLDSQSLLLLSHTVDPVRDTVEALREYADEYHAMDGKWFFLTGEKKELYDHARTGYFVSATEGDGGAEDFIHTERFILVDKQSHIRGYYDGTDSTDVNALIGDIKFLFWQEKVQKHEYQ